MKRIGWWLAATLLVASPAAADVISPVEAACEAASTTVGEACTYPANGDYPGEDDAGPQVSGTCQQTTCHGSVLCDAGRCTTSYPCFTCVPTGKADSQPTSSSPPSSSSSGGSSGGCDVAARGATSTVASLLLAAVVPFALRRRRRAK
jgi:hypothetical protein